MGSAAPRDDRRAPSNVKRRRGKKRTIWARWVTSCRGFDETLRANDPDGIISEMNQDSLRHASWKTSEVTRQPKADQERRSEKPQGNQHKRPFSERYLISADEAIGELF
jgi:hypothetical protein